MQAASMAPHGMAPHGMAHPPSKTAPSVSNLSDLPADVRRYLELTHRKQALLDEVREIQQELRPMNGPTMDKMLQDNLKAFQICPSKEEEAKYGAMGSLELKVKNDYENLSRDTLIRLMTEFYRYVMHDSNPDEVIQIGQGTALWVWGNRKRNPIRYLQRTFAVKPEKRKAPPTTQTEPAQKKSHPKFTPVVNMPHTREEFLAIPAMQKLLQSGPDGIPATDNPESDHEDNQEIDLEEDE